MAKKQMKTIQFPNSPDVYEIVDETARSGKQDKLIAGEGIVIAEDGKTISSNGSSNIVLTDTLNTKAIKFCNLNKDGVDYRPADEALRESFNAKEGEATSKITYSSNLFNRKAYKYVPDMYFSNAVNASLKVPMEGTWGGSGWVFPVEKGKTYTLKTNNILKLTNMEGQPEYGYFMNLMFTTEDDIIRACCNSSGGSYWYKIDGDTESPLIQELGYNTERIEVAGGVTPVNRGMQSNHIIVTIKDPMIKKIWIQVGAPAFGGYQINKPFNDRGHLTIEEVKKLEDGFQINEGPALLPYEPYWEKAETVIEVTSDFDEMRNAFITTPRPSTNILLPEIGLNHKYISNASPSDNKVHISSYGSSCILKIPVTIGNYVIKSVSKVAGSAEKQTIGYFGPIFGVGDDDTLYFNTGYYQSPQPPSTNNKDALEYALEDGSTLLKVNIKEPKIKFLYLPILDDKKNPYGLWTTFQPATGLTDEEFNKYIYDSYGNEGTTLLPWRDATKGFTDWAIKKEGIQGYEQFIEDSNKRIEKIEQDVAKGATKKDIAAICTGDKIYIRTHEGDATRDLVWVLDLVSGGNEYFNFSSWGTCKHSTKTESTISNYSAIKGCGDDICPPSVNGTYIAANHGFNCVDKITSANHGKTNADLGSIWKDSANKQYVLTHIYNTNELGFVYFTEGIMKSGMMGYGNPKEGTVMTHVSGATNTADVPVTKRDSTQFWRCRNHYRIKMLVDNIECSITEGIHEGERVDIITEYDVMFVPAVLQHMMDNVGKNTPEDQHPESVNEAYMTMYVDYQFRRNGSVSTYSAIYAHKQINVGYIGLVQSGAYTSAPYEYIPDTTPYKNLTPQDSKTTFNFGKDTWANQQKVPYRYFQFGSATGGNGMALAYDRSIGCGKNEIRLQRCSQAGMYYSSRKMYPAFLAGGTLAANSYFDGCAIRMPLLKLDDDLTDLCWYWINDDIILMMDTHKALNKDIILPQYMANKKIEILDSEGAICTQTYTWDNKIRFNCPAEYGYLVLKLYD